MAHEINIRNGVAEMAFAGKLPWHGLGQSVDPNATIEQWRTAAGLDWNVAESMVMYRANNTLREYAARKVLHRDDTFDPLSVVGNDYRTVQIATILEFFRDVSESYGYKIHTAGALRGGQKIWVMARNGHVEEAAPGDKLRGNLLLATSYDGTLATTALYTAIRVVCANTLAIAIRNGKNTIKVRHSTDFRPETVKEHLGLIDESFAAFGMQARELARKRMDVTQAKEILAKLFSRPAKLATPEPVALAGASTLGDLMQRPVAISDAPREHRAVGKVLDLFQGCALGAQHAGSAGTAWGLVNAVTQYVDHEQGRSPDTRLHSAWFGAGANVKQEAFEMALAA